MYECWGIESGEREREIFQKFSKISKSVDLVRMVVIITERERETSERHTYTVVVWMLTLLREREREREIFKNFEMLKVRHLMESSIWDVGGRILRYSIVTHFFTFQENFEICDWFDVVYAPKLQLQVYLFPNSEKDTKKIRFLDFLNFDWNFEETERRDNDDDRMIFFFRCCCWWWWWWRCCVSCSLI